MSNELTKALEAIEQSEQLNKPWTKAATDDHAAALDAMRARVEDESEPDEQIMVIRFDWALTPAWVSRLKNLDGTWCDVRSGGARLNFLKAAQMREFVLALTVLAEIAERWELEAGEAATK